MNIFKNVGIKALAVVSALLLWFFVVGVENYVFLFPDEISVKVENLGQNVSVANALVTAKIRYKNANGATVTPNANDINLYLDATGLGEGDYQLPIRFTSKDPKVNIVAVEPALADLKLEAITSKNIDLKTLIGGSPAKDFEVKTMEVDQTKIKLSGAASAIADIKELNLKITLDGSENADFSRKVTLEAPAEWKLSGKTVSFDPAVVQVDIAVRKSLKSTAADVPSLNNNGVTVGNSSATPVSSGMQRKILMVDVVAEQTLKSAVKEFLPANILVTVEGTTETLAQVSNSAIQLIIHSRNVSNGSYTVNPEDLILPNGLSLKVIELSPAKIAVKF